MSAVGSVSRTVARIVVLCSIIISGSGFMIPATYQRKFSRCFQIRSDPNGYDMSAGSEEQSIQDEIREIIQIFVTAEGGVNSVSPSILLENAHILSKGKLYEYAIEKTIEECANVRDIAKIEAVDAFMKGFIISERKQRSRLKMNYMMSGASSNRLDQAIALLSERFAESSSMSL